MANLILFDDMVRDYLLPLTYTRPVCELRLGILTIREKWEQLLGGQASFITQDYLSEKFPITIGQNNLIINGSILPTAELGAAIRSLDANEALLVQGELLAASIELENFQQLIADDQIDELVGRNLEDIKVRAITRLWDIFLMNDVQIREDFVRITLGRRSADIHDSNTIMGEDDIFLEEGADVRGAFLNAGDGPIYIGKGARVMEGAVLRGPVAILDNALVKANATLYGPTTIGPHCKVGGEIKRVVFQGYSNKAHEGFLGDSVVGEWCNLGAGSSNSNLKNTYGTVKVWNYPEGKIEDSGQQFCGLFMGDHSKCSIQTSFNTGTVVGVSANIFGSGLTAKFIPSFAWGGQDGYTTYDLDKACAVAAKVTERRHVSFSGIDRAIFQHISEDAKRFRT